MRPYQTLVSKEYIVSMRSQHTLYGIISGLEEPEKHPTTKLAAPKSLDNPLFVFTLYPLAYNMYKIMLEIVVESQF